MPNAHQTDTTWFIGLGGGFDLNVSRHLGLRFTADWVNTHLFSESTDEPAELREIHDWSNISLGPFLVGAGPRFSNKETGSMS